MHPKVKLLDKVTSALDPEVIGKVLNIIPSLSGEHNLTMLMVTQQMALPMKFQIRFAFS